MNDSLMAFLIAANITFLIVYILKMFFSGDAVKDLDARIEKLENKFKYPYSELEEKSNDFTRWLNFHIQRNQIHDVSNIQETFNGISTEFKHHMEAFKLLGLQWGGAKQNHWEIIDKKKVVKAHKSKK